MKKQKFDYYLLKKKIKSIYSTCEAFANAIGISSTSLSDKLNNKVQFKQNEINLACELLQIDVSDISLYFFSPSVKVA